MTSRALAVRFGLALSLGFASIRPAHAATTGDNGSHDPSRMIESEGKLYIYSTGGGAKSSSDGLAWRNEPAPPWNRSLPNNQGIWAPDIIFSNGQYLLYGSMWSDAKASAIVLLTSPTLNPASPNYRWTDRGVAVAGPAGVSHSVIDPAPLLDNDGRLWVVWGGGYPFPNEANSIFLTRVDNTTGLPVTTDPGYRPPDSPGYALKQGHKEGPYIHFHDGYYYLFYQTGSCCSGASSTYLVHVARSQSVTGPYTDDRNFYGSTGSIHGPGHMGIYSACGFERFTYHYYPDSGGSVIGENELGWSNGWPAVGPESTAPLRPCGTAGGGGMGGAGGIAGSGGMMGGSGIAGAGASGGMSGAGAGGMIGLGGTSGSGGVAGSGDPTTGGTAAGGASGISGTSATGGAAGAGTNGSGGNNLAGNGGTSTATGGRESSGSGGADTSSVDSESVTESGCGCEVRGRKSGRGSLGVWLLALAGTVSARRRRR